MGPVDHRPDFWLSNAAKTCFDSRKTLQATALSDLTPDKADKVFSNKADCQQKLVNDSSMHQSFFRPL